MSDDAVSREAALAAIEECTCLNCRRRPCLCAKGPMIPELAVRHAIATLPPVSPLGLDREGLRGELVDNDLDDPRELVESVLREHQPYNLPDTLTECCIECELPPYSTIWPCGFYRLALIAKEEMDENRELREALDKADTRG